MGSRQYVVLTNSMTLADQKDYRINALTAGIQRSIATGIATWDKTEFPTADPANPAQPSMQCVKSFLVAGGWPKSLDVREFQPILDAGAGAGTDMWGTAALAVVGTLYSVIGAVGTLPIANRANKLLVIYKVAVPVANFPVSRLVFRNNATGNLLAQYDLEPLMAQTIPEGYLSEPFVVDANTQFAVQVLCSLVSASIKVVLGNFLFEPTGQTNA